MTDLLLELDPIAPYEVMIEELGAAKYLVDLVLLGADGGSKVFNAFREATKETEITYIGNTHVEEVAAMTSEKARDYVDTYLGEMAEGVSGVHEQNGYSTDEEAVIDLLAQRHEFYGEMVGALGVTAATGEAVAA